jgi:hypothetical protein
VLPLQRVLVGTQATHIWLVLLQTGVAPLQAVLPIQLPVASQV